jgi:hypothetical protein
LRDEVVVGMLGYSEEVVDGIWGERGGRFSKFMRLRPRRRTEVQQDDDSVREDGTKKLVVLQCSGINCVV